MEQFEEGTTLDRFIFETTKAHASAKGQLATLLKQLALAGRLVTSDADADCVPFYEHLLDSASIMHASLPMCSGTPSTLCRGGGHPCGGLGRVGGRPWDFRPTLWHITSLAHPLSESDERPREDARTHACPSLRVPPYPLGVLSSRMWLLLDPSVPR